jgi:hypothetical protein
MCLALKLGLEDTFCMIDLATVVALYNHLVNSMPRVAPHFAVGPDRYCSKHL